LPSIQILTKEDNRISIKLKGISLHHANALRRICLNGVPIFAIDTVDIIANSSVLPDEGLTHRLGMIPLKTDVTRFDESESRVMFVLDSGDIDTTKTITSADLSSNDEVVKPISDKIPIIQLAPGQKVKLEAYARLGKGTEHAKWNSANVSILTDSDKKDEHLLTVETTGALEPMEIVSAGIEELNRRLEEFKEDITNLDK